jgi:alpha-L-arabinofuranosidase
MGYGHMRGPNTPGEYAQAAAACAEAMKQVDPSIVLVSSGTWWREEWYRAVLAEVGGCFDHIAYHEYTALMKEYAGAEGSEELRRLASAASDVRTTLEEIRERLDGHAPGGKFVGISFDEWNVWHSWFRVPGVAEGIYTAAMLNMFCREARKLGMTIGAYFEPVNEGAIWVDPQSCRLTPAGQVFSLFQAHQGNELIAVELPLAETGVDLAASLNQSKNEVIITVVNGNPDREEEVHITVKSVKAVVRAEGALLTSADFLPESEFVREGLEVALRSSSTLVFTVPPHSVSRIRAEYR